MNDDFAIATAAYRDVVRGLVGDRASTSMFLVAFDRCESPIEQAFCLWLFQLPRIRAAVGPPVDPELLSPSDTASIIVIAQYPVDRYRLDFLLVGVAPALEGPCFVIVECDGDEYHSTPARRHHDALRDRVLLEHGFTAIVRHTGTDILNYPRRVLSRTLSAFPGHGWPLPEWSDFEDAYLRRAFYELREDAGMPATRSTWKRMG